MDSQNMYNQNPVNVQAPVYAPQEPEMTVGGWVGTLILTCIPIVNLILLIVWAVGGSGPKSRKNWAIAQLILMAICIVLSIIFGAAIAGLIATFIASMS